MPCKTTQLGGARYSKARQVVWSLAHYQSQLGHLAFMPGSVSNTEPHITAVAAMSEHYKSLNPAMKGSAGQGPLSYAMLPCTECLRVVDQLWPLSMS